MPNYPTFQRPLSYETFEGEFSLDFISNKCPSMKLLTSSEVVFLTFSWKILSCSLYNLRTFSENILHHFILRFVHSLTLVLGAKSISSLFSSFLFLFLLLTFDSKWHLWSDFLFLLFSFQEGHILLLLLFLSLSFFSF